MAKTSAIIVMKSFSLSPEKIFRSVDIIHNVLEGFRSKLNEFNLISQGERKGFAFKKSAEFIGFKPL